MWSVPWPPIEDDGVSNVWGTSLRILKQTFGALSQDPESPYSRISVANSCFSLDPFRGCPGGCAYCVVASSARDIESPTLGMLGPPELPTIPERLFDGRVLVDALAAHPAFLPHRSVVSIATSSSEPFLPQTHEETWSVLERLTALGLRNPVWFVTKLGFAPQIWPVWEERLRRTRDAGTPVVISITYSGLPKAIEPYSADRFTNADALRGIGIRVSHHLRPIIRGMNDDDDSIRCALQSSARRVDIICVGGLRPDAGLRLAWQHVHGKPAELLPTTGGKDLPASYVARVHSILRELGCEVPVVTRSSEALARLLAIPEFNLYRYRTEHDPQEILFRVPPDATVSMRTDWLHQIRDAATRIGLAPDAIDLAGNALRARCLPYSARTALIHAVGHSAILP
jgi:DNA repair photolyase